MRLITRFRQFKLRRRALRNVADYYIAIDRQRYTDAMPNTQFALGSRFAPGDVPATNFDPHAVYAPPAPTSVTSESDPNLTASVDLLVDELKREDAQARSVAPETVRMNAIRRRAGV